MALYLWIYLWPILVFNEIWEREVHIDTGHLTWLRSHIWTPECLVVRPVSMWLVRCGTPVHTFKLWSRGVQTDYWQRVLFMLGCFVTSTHLPSHNHLCLSLSPPHTEDCLFLSLTQTAGRWNLVVIAARSYLTNRTHCPFDTCVTHLPPIATPPSWPSCIAGT